MQRAFAAGKAVARAGGELRKALGLLVILALGSAALLSYCASTGASLDRRAGWLLSLALTGAAVNALLKARLSSEAETLVLERQDLVERMTAATPDVIYIYDLLNRRHLYLNHSVADVLGYAPEQIVAMGKTALSTIVHPEDLAAVSHSHHRVAGLGDGGVLETEYRVRHVSGEVRWLHAREVVFKRDREGHAVHILGTASDITWRKQSEEEIRSQRKQLQAANEELERLAGTDFLTGLANRRIFFERFELELSRSKRSGKACCIVTADVDEFKSFNDTYGHPAGDEVLQRVAELLGSCLRESDLVARIGGEEFAILLPETDLVEGKATAERLRSAIATHKWPTRTITASFGIALSGGDLNPDNVLAMADEALYASKRGGRNRVTAFAAGAAAIHPKSA